MALPPEPLAVVLPLASRIVLAEVQDATALPPVPRTDTPIGAARLLPEQTVRLLVRETLRGPESAEITALKPEAGYVLAAGHHGPFLLDASPVPRILGRYGPDTYSLAALKKALATGSP